MKKIVLFCMLGCVGLMNFGAVAAVKVKKAESVKKQETSGIESVTSGSLLPGVMGLVSSVSALNKQQKELEAECVPTSQEISWVTKMVKEYAKAGGAKGTGWCSEGAAWEQDVRNNMFSTKKPTCGATVFSGKEADDYIWKGYPKPEVVEYCADSSDFTNCAANKKKKTTNLYTIFSMIDFGEEDYTADEVQMYHKLMEKMEKCAPEKIAARKKQAYAGFITSTISNAGQSTNTGSIMDAVGGLTQSMGGGSGLSGSLGGLGSMLPSVTQFLGAE